MTDKGGSTPLQPPVPLNEPPRTPGKPGLDAWEPGEEQPGGVPARKQTPPGAPGQDEGTDLATDGRRRSS